MALTEGAYINDICKILGFFDPLPPCPHLELIYTIQFTQPPLLCPLFYDPPPTSDAEIISGGSLNQNPERMRERTEEWILR